MTLPAMDHPEPHTVSGLRTSLDSNGASAIDRLEISAARFSLPEQQKLAGLSLTDQTQQASALSPPSSPTPAPLRIRAGKDAKSIEQPLHSDDKYHDKHNDTILSPHGSVRSARTFSWTQTSSRPSRANSRNLHSRALPEPEQEGRPLDSMLSRTNTNYSRNSTSNKSPFPVLEEAGQGAGGSELAQNQHTLDLLTSQVAPVRSASTASKASTLQGARSLFRDFDGTHYNTLPGHIAEEDEEEEEDMAAGESSSLLRADEDLTNDNLHAVNASDKDGEDGMSFINFEKASSRDQQLDLKDHEEQEEYEEQEEHEDQEEYDHFDEGDPHGWAVPPPDDNMVYYPAPVPMNLNLPKRLSQQPNAAIQAQRRSQVLGAMGADARRSAAWLSGEGANIEPRQRSSYMDKRKTVNLAKLPPQLRASVFFDHGPVQHEFAVQRNSAVLTLERMLDLSAQTPVGVPPSMSEQSQRPRKSQSAYLGGAGLGEQGGQALHQRTSNLALGEQDQEGVDQDNLAELAHQADADDHDIGHDYVHIAGDAQTVAGLDRENADHYDQGQLDEAEAAVPNTLLAELQLRKAQLKSRNRTAATAFPDGMHSTLLELDAVAQVEKSRRRGKPTQLAWEDTEEKPISKAGQDDEDVPLGLLYSNRNGLVNKAGERAVGLMEKREQDDNEPLSRRRNRILGIQNPVPDQHARNQSRGSVPVLGVVPQDVGEPEVEETLAQRTRRLRSSKALDAAIGIESGKHLRAVSDDFASEMMSQLGVEASPNASNDATTPEPEETLGQRRRRLQGERQASANDNADGQHARAELRSSHSLANILASAPAGVVRVDPARAKRVGSSGLLGASDVELAARRQYINERNRKSSVFLGQDGPLVDVSSHARQPALVGRMNQERNRMSSYNDGAGGLGMRVHSGSSGPDQSLGRKSSAMSLGLVSGSGGRQTPMLSPQLQQQQHWSTQGYNPHASMLHSTASLQAGHFYSPSAQAQYWQQQMYPTMTPALHVNTNVGVNGMRPAEASLSAEQRTVIDRWRQGVMP